MTATGDAVRNAKTIRAGCFKAESIWDSSYAANLIQHAGWGRRPAWMAKPYSVDLRERVVAAVEAVEEGGLSRRAAASQFGVGISTAIAWVRRFRATGSIAPGQM